MKQLLAVFIIAFLLPVSSALAANPSYKDALHAAKAGDPRAQYMLGMMYVFGQGTQQNIPEGAQWLERSAQNKLPQALVALAALYDVGQGVPQDVARAKQLREQAARMGNETARGQLEDDDKMPGQADFRRASVLMDLQRPAAAIPYAETAAVAHSANAELLLCRAYLFGNGIAKDVNQAFHYCQRSAAGGLPDGARGLAYLYEFGLGTPVDRKLALQYYDQAAAGGSKLAKQAAANLRSPDYDQPVVSGGTGGSGGGSRCGGGYSFNYAQGSCDPMFPGMNSYNP